MSPQLSRHLALPEARGFLSWTGRHSTMPARSDHSDARGGPVRGYAGVRSERERSRRRVSQPGVSLRVKSLAFLLFAVACIADTRAGGDPRVFRSSFEAGEGAAGKWVAGYYVGYERDT